MAERSHGYLLLWDRGSVPCCRVSPPLPDLNLGRRNLMSAAQVSQLQGRQKGQLSAMMGAALCSAGFSAAAPGTQGPSITPQGGGRSHPKDPEHTSHTAGLTKSRPLSLGNCRASISPSECQSAVRTTRSMELERDSALC